MACGRAPSPRPPRMPRSWRPRWRRPPRSSRRASKSIVYHDRTSSRVLIGSFNAPNDPAAVRLRDHLLRVAVGIMDTNQDPVTKKPRHRGVHKMIVPAEYLTDLGADQGPEVSEATRS